jgi:hypothetical protein
MEILNILAFAICIGVIPGFIAQKKGRSFVEWWLYGAALFIVALPHSIMIKPDQEEIEGHQLDSGTVKRCPFCAEIIKQQAIVCRYCGRDIPANEATVRVRDGHEVIAEEHGFVKGADADGQTWWAGNELGGSVTEDHNLYLTIYGGKWWLGSTERSVEERISKVRGYLDLEASENVQVTDRGISGSTTRSLSAALHTYRWLVSQTNVT